MGMFRAHRLAQKLTKGKFCIIDERPVNNGSGVLQVSSAKWGAKIRIVRIASS